MPYSDQAASEYLEALTKVSRRIRTVFNQQVTAHGLTYPRARALFRLARKQNMTQTELACELELEQATMVRLLDRMEENGLIERRPDPRDRRVKLIVLTPHGQEQAAFVRAVADEIRHQFFEGVDLEELKQGIALLEKISANVSNVEDTNVLA
ncbi:MarR family transcriptional regulator, transcriptional regulator for hemolysin [Rhizobium sp. NFR07]|jgi:MarR family transcriptional regulator, transcriptional regulator for hemolysin|uniref:MarR family winged helix-turn-helix transcriptional regulator n=1 Tax=Rhizobium sp. NFR07 TaxID=1566262 RepID=UPI0008E7C87F|nr:MarR family transcriptional regulator [Rhizobium sp. NFR07]SFA78084.1 MarR family transcriptional regulator, transcriptional regulator for hemolysin [Rhizobium sp. NFR07]